MPKAAAHAERERLSSDEYFARLREPRPHSALGDAPATEPVGSRGASGRAASDSRTRAGQIRAVEQQRGALGDDVLRVLHRRIRTALETVGGREWRRLFAALDLDHNGMLSEAELLRLLRGDLSIPPSEIRDGTVRRFRQMFDVNGDGVLDVQELISFFEDGPEWML